MKKNLILALAATLLGPSAAIHAENAIPPAAPAPAISQERMQKIYEEVKTPYKYGVSCAGRRANSSIRRAFSGRTGSGI